MAYYAYKEVRDLIPEWFSTQYINKWNDECPDYPYDHDPNYDGNMWCLTADYIRYLQAPKEKQDSWFS